MAPRLRAEYPSAIYHVMARGNARPECAAIPDLLCRSGREGCSGG